MTDLDLSIYAVTLWPQVMIEEKEYVNVPFWNIYKLGQRYRRDACNIILVFRLWLHLLKGLSYVATGPESYLAILSEFISVTLFLRNFAYMSFLFILLGSSQLGAAWKCSWTHTTQSTCTHLVTSNCAHILSYLSFWLQHGTYWLVEASHCSKFRIRECHSS